MYRFIGLYCLIAIFLYADNALFDASQYEFFGQNAVEEVDLGGLEDGEEDSPVFASTEDDEYHLFDREVRFYSFGYT